MLLAAKYRKDRHLKFFEDEITSIVLGPLIYMPPEDVWKLFRKWLPFKSDLWPIEISNDMKLSFWPNIAKAGRIEPDLLVQFTRNDAPVLTVLFEIKWSSPLSGYDELVKQWEALEDKEKKSTFHIYLVKETGKGNREVIRSLENSNDKIWRERLVCIGWRSLIETLQFDRPKFGRAMDLWADGIIAFLRRRGQTTFTGFTWLEGKSVSTPPASGLFWRLSSWFSELGQKINIPSTELFWRD